MPDGRDGNEQRANINGNQHRANGAEQRANIAIKPPGQLSFTGNLCKNWNNWKQQFEIYLELTDCDEAPQKKKCALLKYHIGQEALEVLNTFQYTVEEEATRYKATVEKFDSYFSPQKNVTFERHVFFTREQQPDERIEAYVTELRRLSATCEFEKLRDGLIRDRVICGIQNSAVRTRLLHEPKLTLGDAIDMIRGVEQAQMQLRTIEQKEADVHAIRHKPKQYHQGTAPNRRPHAGQRSNSYAQNGAQQPASANKCKYCGYHHPSKKCPAYGAVCKKCSRKNHFASVCLTSVQSKVHCVSNEANVSTEQVNCESDDNFFIHTITNLKDESDASMQREKREWRESVTINGHVINIKLDPGAQANMLSKDTFDKLDMNVVLMNTKGNYLDFSNNCIPIVGRCKLPVKCKGKCYDLWFTIAKFKCQDVLGLAACEDLNLVARVTTVNVLDEFPDVFEGLGCLPGKYKVIIDSAIQPVQEPPRRCPIGLTDKFKSELDRMENLNVITKITEPTDWVNSYVLVKKPDSNIRVCLDPRNLNKAIKCSSIYMQRIEDISAKLSKAKWFSVLDAKCGYWTLELDEPSSKLFTFATPFGRYAFKRLPYGAKCSSELFQNALNQIFDGLEGIAIFADDVLIWGSTKEDHDARLAQVLQRARDANLKLNKNKSQSATNSVTYLGHIFTDQGLLPDPSKVSAIIDMAQPQNRKDLERFLGMVNYLTKFLPNIAQQAKNLRDLLKKNTVWIWDVPQQEAFHKVKETITKASALQYFDPDAPVTLSVDCSQTGVGAVLLQPKGPVAYASQSLTPAQQNYFQIEREMFAIVFGCTRFHHFVYGRTVNVETDHQPLETLFKKPLHKAPPKIQRMMLKVEGYDLQVKYKPGKELYVADTLSRAAVNICSTNDKDVNLHVDLLQNNMPVSNEKLDKIAQATKLDSVLKNVMEFCEKGWPENKKNLKGEQAMYWDYKEELHVLNDIVMKGSAIVIPQSIRIDMLNQLHEGHVGIMRCKIRARQLLFWPGMAKQIETLISNCKTCLKYAHMLPSEPLTSEPVPLFPWQVVASDIFDFNNHHYLLVVDYYSKFFEIRCLPNLLSGTVIDICKSIFSVHGIPWKLVSDNGPQYDSQKFKEFCKAWKIVHRTSSPTHAQGNGLAERTIQTVKDSLKKCHDSKGDPYLTLLHLRNMPVILGYSPSEISMSRVLNSTLPVQCQVLQSKSIPHEKIYKELKCKQERSAHYFNTKTRQRPPLKIGEQVMVKVFDKWQEGFIQSKVNDKSFWVQTKNSTYRRNKCKIVSRNSFEPELSLLDFPIINDEVNGATVNTNDNEIIDSPQETVNTDNKNENVQVEEQSPVRRSKRKHKPKQKPNM